MRELRTRLPRSLVRRPVVIILLFVVLVACGAARRSFSQQGTVPPPFSAVVGYSSSVFCYLDRENSQAAARLWANLVLRRKNGNAETRVFQNQAELERQLQGGRLDLVVLLPNEFLSLANRSLLEPLYVSTRSNELYDSLLLIARNDSGIASMRNLRGKTLLHPRGAPNAVHRLWLETLTMQQGVRDPERYFSSQKEVISSSQALMPVFFRRADACVISRNSFNVMAELNPQLRSQMRVVEETVPMATGVICIRRGCDPRQREQLMEILNTLDQTVEGQQLLTLFRMSRLVPFRNAYLTSSEVFLNKYRQMKNEATRGGS